MATSVCALMALTVGHAAPLTVGAAGADRQLTFVGVAHNAPFLSVDEQGRPQGYTAELLRALGRSAGIEITFQLVPHGERSRLLTAGAADLMAVAVNSPSAAKTTLLVPLWHVREMAVYRSRPGEAPKAYTDLANDIVAVSTSSLPYGAITALPPELRPTVVPVESVAQALEKLRSGEATVALGDSLGLRHARAYWTMQPLHAVEMRSVPVYLATTPDRTDLQPIFAAAYLRLQESGELVSIIERTLMNEPRREAWGSWATYGLTAVAIAAIAFVAILVWSRSLRIQVQRRTRELRDAGDRQAFQAYILSQVTDAIVVTDAEGYVRSWNAGAETVFGRPAAEALGKRVGDVIVERGTATSFAWRAELGSADEWKGDAEVVRPKGDPVYVAATVRRIADEHGTAGGRLIVARDIDATRRAELDARTRARQQAAIASLGQRALAGIDFEWLICQAMSVVTSTLRVSAAGLFQLDERETLVLRAGEGLHASRIRHTRISKNSYPGCVLSTTALALVSDHAHERRFETDALMAQEEIGASLAVVVPGRAGAYGVLIAAQREVPQATFSRDDVHFLQAVANVLGAAFERAAIELDLRTELALHHATLEATAEGILVTDQNGRVTRHNQTLIEMWGYPPDVVASHDAARMVEWTLSLIEDSDARLADFRRACRSQTVDETVIRLKDGRVFERHSQPQRLDGAIVGRVWCYRDITERVQAEDERRRMEAHMQHVQKLESLGVLAGGIAHDFNNLLVGILGHAGLALMELPADSSVYDGIKQIETAAQRAAELTNQMLAYSGKGRFVLKRLDLSDIVGEMAKLLRTAIAKNAQLDIQLERQLPAFNGDPAQIRQVVMNLITNASDAIGQAVGRIEVRTGLLRATHEYFADAWIGNNLPAGEFVFVEVRDTGCGMDDATLARIFDPFFTTKFTGRGLGLAAVLGIVRGHHGAIKIASSPGAGTTFQVLLPATGAAVAEVAAPPSAPVIVSGAKVLVVDDEAGVRLIARESLKRAGFDVTTVNDGEEAVAMIRRGEIEFDAVLLDMTMPRMSGSEAFRVMRELRPQLPVVLTSGYSSQDAMARFGVDGLAGFVQKPFLPATLVRTIHEAIGSKNKPEAA